MVIIQVVLCIITAILAARKGYNPFIWFFASGVIGLIILAFLPFVNEKSALNEDERAVKKRKGNIIGGVIAALAIIITLAIIIAE
ncbi:hypothetical protein D8Y20_11165 [Mariprofundus sp. EBB-1]|uniref:hypothetical protein n=1 Tax=Mariprofundus sp. EBB-1 TaxID=2650971 RepID=UPI000EF1EE5B|nr:hypothetical protein [Mariprofundus sp. EBB-1]RLL50739.1 hypothetical protein D8Y20_11165 [Mariprofundus sp. EBB-1]